MEIYWPGVTSLCRELDKFWYEKASGKPRMDFGLFYNMAINVDMGERVKSIPHRDLMNLAFGVCAIMVFGGSALPCLAKIAADVCYVRFRFFP